ncbi:putative F-box/FBD/LRR-repeat protein [Raphanus sativus]|nr:putative F-box/FBD/LRR-repeat protein [Raphanus sativus]
MKAARLGTEELTCSDTISHLPDDLLFRILSLVPMRTAMSTSLLSKRWNYVRKPEDDANARYSDFIDTLLFPNIRSTLLEITIDLNYFSPIRFPSNLNVFKTLLVLKLQGWIALDVVDSHVCFPSLKSLHLTRVKFDDNESLIRILSACPVLEDLYLQRLCSCGCFVFTISVPSLERLSITNESAHHCSDAPRFEIHTPSLKYLNIIDRACFFTFVDGMPKLVEANISVKTGKLMKVNSLERLSLSLYSSLPSMASHFKDTSISNPILQLELPSYNTNRLSLLMHLLRPLKLNKKYGFTTGDFEDQPSSLHECLSFHLETLEWKGYAGTLEENEVVTYILKNAHCLKTATISLRSNDTEKLLLIEKELRSLTKASGALCQLVIKYLIS